MADEYIPYIKYDAKVGGFYPTIELCSLPFPTNNIPDIFNLRFFIIETIDDEFYLRSTINSLFCYQLKDNAKFIEVPALDTEEMNYVYDENGEIIYKKEQLNYLSFTYKGIERTVAYYYSGKSKTFLQMHKSTIPFSELDNRLQRLYMATKMLTVNSLEILENESQKMDMKKNGLRPKGEWEEEMFRDVFHNNTSLMSDDEYEMIFGVER
jgi:hypothetical protein